MSAQLQPSVPLHPHWGRRAYSVFAEVSRWSRTGFVSADEDHVRLVPTAIQHRLEADHAIIIRPGGLFPSLAPTTLILLFNAAIDAGELR